MKSKTLLRLLGAIFAFALVAAACGDDEEAAVDETTEEAEAQTTEEAEPQETTEEAEPQETTEEAEPQETTEEAEPADDAVPAGVAAAQAVSDELRVLPTSIGLTEPIEGDIPTGLRIVVIPINVPSAIELITFLQEAAAVLGWTAESVSGGTTPEEFKAAFAQVCADAPDAVFSLGIPSAVVTEELECLRDAGIPMVFQSTAPEGVQDSDLVLANIYDHTPQFISGTHNANWVIADSGGNANIVYYDFGAVETVHYVSLGFEETINERCPNCTFERIDVPAEDIGTNLPGQIVSYLRANSDTNYVALAFSDLAIGVPGALADAGIGTDEVRLIGANPGPGNRVNIAAGNYEQAAISFPKYESQWRVIDIFARHFAGESVDHPQDAVYPYFMYSSDNVDQWAGAPEDEWPLVQDYKEQYLALWGVG